MISIKVLRIIAGSPFKGELLPFHAEPNEMINDFLGFVERFNSTFHFSYLFNIIALFKINHAGIMIFNA